MKSNNFLVSKESLVAFKIIFPSSLNLFSIILVAEDMEGSYPPPPPPPAAGPAPPSILPPCYGPPWMESVPDAPT